MKKARAIVRTIIEPMTPFEIYYCLFAFTGVAMLYIRYYIGY